ncbi:hypothetical protein KG088_18085 [Halomonas sp. TRM85114]|uniref:hypothetical protein n=1 Tax=Halomonas jincaotanensis TaxID=2810616 RepID=UPI001BD6820B|nr:hypothetical protein [Halomonas jincaotanensis]MBS9405516.1 hypothetical protein [Halomonas jincaotanensis]
MRHDQAHLFAGALVALLDFWRCEVMPGRRDIHVLTTERRLRSRKVRAFLDYLFASLSPHPPWDRWREATLTDSGRSSGQPSH